MSSDTPECQSLAFSEIRIEAFRRLAGVTLGNLHRLNLIVGDNHIGKTSVLEAVRLLAQGWGLNTLDEMQTARAPFDRPRESIAEATFSLFRIVDPQQAAALHLEAVSGWTRRQVRASMRRTGAESFHVKAVASADEALDDQVESGPFPATTSLNSSFERLGAAFPIAWVGLTDHLNESNQSRLLSALVRTKKRDHVVQLLNQLDGEIKGLALVVNPDNEHHVLVEKDIFGLALPHFGNAVRRFLLLAMTITSIPNGVLLVDEAEASIHWSRFPQMATALLELLHESNVQAFFTTQSLELIDAFVDATPETDDVALYRLTRAPDDGRTVVTTLKEEHVRTLRHMLARELR